MKSMYSKQHTRKLCFLVILFSLSRFLIGVLADEASYCRVNDIVGDYVSYSDCQFRRGIILRNQSQDITQYTREYDSTTIVCCGITRSTSSQLYSFQKAEISGEIETISELKQILENPTHGESEHGTPSIYPRKPDEYNKNSDLDNDRFEPLTSTIRSYPVISPSHDRRKITTSTHKTTRHINVQWDYLTTPTLFNGNAYNLSPTKKPLHNGLGGNQTTTKAYNRGGESGNKKNSVVYGPWGESSTRRSTVAPRPTRERERPQQSITEDPNGYLIYPTLPASPQTTRRHTQKLRISQRKCKEYSEEVEEKIAGLPLLANPQPFEVNIDRCNHNAQQLIVGGQNASLGEFPHMVAVGFMDERRKNILWNCGGSLISENFVLTAAHCTTSRLGSPTLVRVGEHNLKREDDGAHPVQYFVKEVIRHPEYMAHSRYHDIALLRLSRRVTFTPHIRPACLYQRLTFNTGKTVAAGWGRMAYHEEQSDVLLKVVLSIFDNEQCNKLYLVESSTEVLNRGIIDQQMCAGELTGGKDTCQGDSGGPIEVTSAGSRCVHHIIGVTSFGKKCGQPNAPGVYTRVSSYVDWIESVVWPQELNT